MFMKKLKHNEQLLRILNDHISMFMNLRTFVDVDELSYLGLMIVRNSNLNI